MCSDVPPGGGNVYQAPARQVLLEMQFSLGSTLLPAPCTLLTLKLEISNKDSFSASLSHHTRNLTSHSQDGSGRRVLLLLNILDNDVQLHI